MFQNYLKIAFRHISRNKTYVLVNVIGLGLALACCIIAFVNYNTALNADTFHENHEHIVRVIYVDEGFDKASGDIATPFAPKVVEEISGVKSAVRFNTNTVIVQPHDEVFKDRLAVVDPNFLDFFSFPLVEGDKATLKDPSKILITEKIAKKYYGTNSALNQTIAVNLGKENQKDFVIGGVLKDLPNTSSLKFDLLTNISYLEWGPKPDTLSYWSHHMAATFLHLENPNNREEG